MKPARLLAVLWLPLLPLAQSTAGAAAPVLDWYSIDGGVGTASGGPYSLSATIGQPDSGPVLAGGAYQLTGGFWAVVSTTGAGGVPALTIALDPSTGEVHVEWPDPSTGWVLQQNPRIEDASGWTDSAAPAVTVGSRRRVTLTTPSGIRFLRLRHP
jgi:hypothetical protein